VPVVVFVACLPVLVLGAGATLHHLLRDTDTHQHQHDTVGRAEPARQVHSASAETVEPVDVAVVNAIAAPEARESWPAPSPVVFSPADPRPTPAPTRAAGSGRKPGRTKSRKEPAPRKLLADYAAQARQELTAAKEDTDLDPSPSWCQRVTGCSDGTSVKLARLLRAEQTNHTDPADQPGDTGVAAGGSPTVERDREAA
jgi:hypothetical protein